MLGRQRSDLNVLLINEIGLDNVHEKEYVLHTLVPAGFTLE